MGSRYRLPSFPTSLRKSSKKCESAQNRPLEALYPILYVDCLVVKVRENQRVITKAVYLVLAVTMEGQKELLGMWMSENEGAKFWLSVFTQLHNRGMKDCFIGGKDGLTGLPEAIEAVFPQTRVQLCMVHAGRATRSRMSPTNTAKLSRLISRPSTRRLLRRKRSSIWN